MVTTLFLSMMLSLVASVLSPFFVELVSVIMMMMMLVMTMLVVTVLIPLMMATLFVVFMVVVSLTKITLLGHFALFVSVSIDIITVISDIVFLCSVINLIGFLSCSWLFWNGVLLVILGFSCGLWNWHCHGQLNQTDTGQRNQQQHLHLGTLSTPSEGVYAKKFSNPFSNPNSPC